MKHIHTSLFVLSTLGLVGVAACGGEETADSTPAAEQAEGGAGGEGGETGQGGGGASDPQNEDLEAPTLVSTSPVDGAVGVEGNKLIALQFSEPMDTASVEAAYHSEALPQSAVSFSWDVAKTTLSVVPAGGLAYAEGDIDVAALAYDITIGDSATDLAGNPLAEPATTTFETLRHITQQVPAVPELTGYLVNGTLGTTNKIVVGDRKTVGEYEVRGFMTFDITDVPDETEFESITVRSAQTDVVGDPSDGALGALHLESVFYETIDLAAYNYGADAPGAELVVGGGEVPVWTASVSALVLDDLANREARDNLTQYRLRYIDGPDDDGVTDELTLSPEGTTLELVYLAE